MPKAILYLLKADYRSRWLEIKHPGNLTYRAHLDRHGGFRVKGFRLPTLSPCLVPCIIQLLMLPE